MANCSGVVLFSTEEMGLNNGQVKVMNNFSSTTTKMFDIRNVNLFQNAQSTTTVNTEHI